MGQGSAVARRIPKGDFDHLIVTPDEIQGYAQTLFAAVARRAYELFESRGLVHGYDRDDWYRAESELVDPINVELSDSGNAFLAVADVAGYRPENLSVSVESRSLQVYGRLPAEQNQSRESEEELRRLEGFFFSFELPVCIDTSQASADIRHNLLEVHLPKAIPQTEGDQKQIMSSTRSTSRREEPNKVVALSKIVAPPQQAGHSRQQRKRQRNRDATNG